jgi:hypothetical protein
MRSRVIAAVITLGCAAAAPIAVTQAAGSPLARTARCVHARIGGQRKCLATGQSCAHKYERQYEQHGFACIKTSAHGRYHLISAQQQQQG